MRYFVPTFNCPLPWARKGKLRTTSVFMGLISITSASASIPVKKYFREGDLKNFSKE